MTALDQARTQRQERSAARPFRGLRLLAAAALLAAVLSRLHTGSALWLDEALSVHIARLPLDQLHAALRQDGAPPVYYLLLHGWMRVFGQSPSATRALSSVLSLAALPAAWALGRRWRDAPTAWTTVLLLASSPFAVRYATETRMYALVVLEVTVGGLLLLRAAERPSVGRLVPLSVVTALLVLTHYWSLFLLACLGVGLLWRARRGRTARRLVLALVGGGVLVVPWLPTLLFQVSHTGTPWAPAPSLVAALDTVGSWAGDDTLAARVLALLLFALGLLAVLGRATAEGVLLARPADRRALLLLALSAGPLLLGLVVGLLGKAGYAPRYSAIALPAALLLVAAGLRVLPGRLQTATTAVVVVLGLVGAVRVPFEHHKTQAAVVATAIRARLAPGDLVVACPDQLGVAVQDLLPAGTEQAVYPTLARPDRIDWVDYAQRNQAADPAAFVQRLLARAGTGTIWLVVQGGYRTFGSDCQAVAAGLAASHQRVEHPVTSSRRYDEKASLYRYSGRR